MKVEIIVTTRRDLDSYSIMAEYSHEFDVSTAEGLFYIDEQLIREYVHSGYDVYSRFRFPAGESLHSFPDYDDIPF